MVDSASFDLLTLWWLVVVFAACPFALCGQYVLCCVFGCWIGGLWWFACFDCVRVEFGLCGECWRRHSWFAGFSGVVFCCLRWLGMVFGFWFFGGFVVVVYVVLGC